MVPETDKAAPRVGAAIGVGNPSPLVHAALSPESAADIYFVLMAFLSCTEEELVPLSKTDFTRCDSRMNHIERRDTLSEDIMEAVMLACDGDPELLLLFKEELTKNYVDEEEEKDGARTLGKDTVRAVV